MTTPLLALTDAAYALDILEKKADLDRQIAAKERE
jgi:hypothetical protein